MSSDLQTEESILKQSIEKLKVVEANRLALVSELKEALSEQVIKNYFKLYAYFLFGLDEIIVLTRSCF